MSSSCLRLFSSFSISVWHVWQTYRWLTAGPPPYLRETVHTKLTRYFSQRNRWIWRCLKPPASLKAAVSTSCTCCKGDPTRSVAASLPGHQWMSLCWAAHLMKRSETAVRRLQCNILFYMKCNSSHGYRSVVSLNRASSSTMHNSVKFTAQTVLPLSLNILQFLLFSDPQSLLLKLLPKLHV